MTMKMCYLRNVIGPLKLRHKKLKVEYTGYISVLNDHSNLIMTCIIMYLSQPTVCIKSLLRGSPPSMHFPYKYMP